ncbi:MAG: DUF4112 domain-containing protein [Bacteroidia bacterium]
MNEIDAIPPNETEEDAVQYIPELEWIDRITNLLDSKFKLPFLSTRFGLDPILGLIPFAGDIVTLIMSAFMVVAMARHGASGALALRMIFNIVIDFAAGSVPFIGDILDFRLRANRRNYILLREHYYENEHQGSGWGIIFGIILMLVVILGLTVWAVWRFLAWVF